MMLITLFASMFYYVKTKDVRVINAALKALIVMMVMVLYSMTIMNTVKTNNMRQRQKLIIKMIVGL